MSSLAGRDDGRQPQGDGKPRRSRKSKPKVKTGCHTCRIRRIKCDEGLPACNRCLSTNRVCDGYPSVFRNFTAGGLASFSGLATHSESSLSLYQPRLSVVTADGVDTLAHFFHRRRQVNVSYRDEARAILAKLSDPVVRLALDSLSALHDGVGQRQHAAERSLGAYNAAVSGLALRLRERPGWASAQAALVCCQMFISIEVMLGDYTNAVQHFLLGLRVMYQYGRATHRHHSPDLPLLDAFAVKLFASGYPGPGRMSAAANGPLCERARSDLGALSARVLPFLSRVTGLRGHVPTPELLVAKAQILRSLQSWEHKYSETVREAMGTAVSVAGVQARFGAAFSLLLHRVLKLVVGLAMTAAPLDPEALKRDFDALGEIASFATKTRKAADMNRA